MLLREIYKSDIDRTISGVIKVTKDDDSSIKQELSEYVVTRELNKHFNTFLTNYENSIDFPTDEIGVWISGFYGSGKSHLLKILSYLLSNKIVDGKKAVDYFQDKFGDPLMFAQLEKCISIPTDTILFNIDVKSSINKDETVILRTFAKEFYDHLGFYGRDLKVAKLEQFISKKGKLDEFKAAFESVHGQPWVQERDSFSFFEDDVVQVLQDVLGMSETSARNWFNGEETGDLSIDQLVDEINEYVNSRGKDYRLLFMVDEVGQYIDDKGSLMLNLQSIVEEIGSRCRGRVWVMVTSQEAIDTITKISGYDFSKIQARFKTRLSLSSSSVDEVIKRRLLDKTELATKMLKMKYGENDSVLRNLFTFNGAVLDLKGYSSEAEYVETYPFVPYQFRLLQNVLAEIRKKGNSGQYMSGGERSMLSGFQEAAQAIENKDENALVPFYMFYDTVHTFLASSIRRVIDRCQEAADNNDGIKAFDVNVLKLLYLIRHISDIKPNVDNIATLMLDEIGADKIVLRQQVQESLDRLVSQNYVSRSGELYMFLTDEEQEIAIDIRTVQISSSEITQRMVDIIYGDIYPSKKFKHDKYDFEYDQLVDEAINGSLTGAIKLRILTVASDMYTSADQALILKSSQNEAIIKLSDEYPYFEEIENALKIRKYVKSKNVAQLPEAIQAIIRGKQQQASAYEKNAKELIEKAIASGTIFAAGDRVESKSGNARATIDDALSYLVDGVYTKLSDVKNMVSTDMDILNILNDKQEKLSGYKSPNSDALSEIDLYLQMQEGKHLPTSMGDLQKRFKNIPYGWREIDIAALVAELINEQKVQITYSGTVIQPDDRKIPDYLRKKTEIDKTIVAKRHAIDPALMETVRKILKEYFNIMDIPQDEDGLIKFITDKFSEQKQALNDLLVNYSTGKYPGKDIVESGIKLIDDILSQRKDNIALMKAIKTNEDDLLDLNEDLGEVRSFFKNQRGIFDEATKLACKMEKEEDNIKADTNAVTTLKEINEIIGLAKPYKRISELPTLIQQVEKSYSVLLDGKRKEVNEEINAAKAELESLAEDKKDILDKAINDFNQKANQVTTAETITQLDAMKPAIQNQKQLYIKKLMEKPVEDTTAPKVNYNETTRSAILPAANLKSKADIDAYVDKLKQKLMKELEGYDELHLI